jgi:ribonuclease VapC
MILDSSALVAIALDEPERPGLLAKITAADVIAVGAPTLVEAGIVLSARMGVDATDVLAELVTAADAVVVEFGPDHWMEAMVAWRRFGKGRHPASLNFGDCLAYATARVAGLPLLAKGEGFPKTDIELAWVHERDHADTG